MKEAIAAEGLKATPPITVSVVAFTQGLTINEAVAYATLAYIAMQAAYLLWKWWREYKASKES